MSSRHFGERDHYTTTELRRENAAARRSVNWSPEYPPVFYGRVEVEDIEPAHPYYSAPVEPVGGGEWF